MNIEQARAVLEDLENQLKAANDHAVLMNGAVQGAKAIIQALEQEAAAEEVAVPSEDKKGRKPKGN